MTVCEFNTQLNAYNNSGKGEWIDYNLRKGNSEIKQEVHTVFEDWSRSATVIFLTKGAIVIGAHNTNCKSWDSNGLIRYDKLVDYVTNIDKIQNVEDYHISSKA